MDVRKANKKLKSTLHLLLSCTINLRLLDFANLKKRSFDFMELLLINLIRKALIMP